MKFKVKECTFEELEESLEENLIDLLGDVLLLECACYCEQQNIEMPTCFDGEVTEVCIHRLNSYIEQHTKEIASTCRIMAKAL